MRLAVFALAVTLAGAGPGWAGTELYIFDVLHRPVYAATYNRMMYHERNLPSWFASAESASKSTTTPATTIKVGSQSEDLFKLCQPHQCANGTLAVLFSDDGDRSVAAFSDDSTMRYFGNPTAAERAALQAAAQGGI